MPHDSDDEPEQDEEDDFEEEPQMDKSMRHSIVVDNVPAVPKEKVEKLKGVLNKFFGQIGKIIEGGLELPTNADTGAGLGYAFIEFESESVANLAIQKANGYKLDKAHTFQVNSFEDYDKYMAVPDEEKEFEPPPFESKENLLQWLEDGHARDQFVARYNEETEIWWNDPAKPNQEALHSRKHWSDSYVSWSPRGTYLATFHRLGIKLWGGPSWKCLLKINHGGVALIDFSPCENFLVTWSPETDQESALIIHNVKTGEKCRSFQGTTEPGAEMQWPAFLWSFDDQYFARLGADCIYVYEAATCKLVHDKDGKRTGIKRDGVRQFLWSPTDHVVSLWIPEHTNNPAKVVLIELPSRQELRQKNLFNVADLRMLWHDQGHFLCVKVDKHSKSKKTLNSAFELFRLRDKGVPIEVVEFTKDTSVYAFAWEPKGLRYAIIKSEASNTARMDVSFYTMGSKYNGHHTLVKTLEKKSCSGLWWSPVGSIILLGNLKGTAGQLEWIDVNQQQTIGEAEHFMCSNLEWDPTGRYVASSVSHWKHQMENGYHMWTSHGRELRHEKKEKFYQLLWRPRPPSLLSEAKEKEINKNLRLYSKKYEEEDAKLKLALDAGLLKERQQQSAVFEAELEKRREDYNSLRAKRIEMRGGVESDAESAYTVIEEEERENIEITEEVIDDGEEIEIGDD